MVVMSRLSFYFSFLLLLHLCVAQSDEYDLYYSPIQMILIVISLIVFFVLGCFCVNYMLKCNEPEESLAYEVRQVTGAGLDAAVVETFPTFRYSTVKTLRNGCKEDSECTVCLNEFEDNETLRLIPQCRHVFHFGCIGAWLRSRATCPLCRANLVPIPDRSVSIEIPGVARETGLNSLGAQIDDNRTTVLDSSDEPSMSSGSKLAGLASQSGSIDQTGENADRVERSDLPSGPSGNTSSV